MVIGIEIQDKVVCNLPFIDYFIRYNILDLLFVDYILTLISFAGRILFCLLNIVIID